MLPRYLRFTQHLALVGAAACSGSSIADSGAPQDGGTVADTAVDSAPPVDVARDTPVPVDTGVGSDVLTADVNVDAAVDVAAEPDAVTPVDTGIADATVFDVPLIDAPTDVPTTVDVPTTADVPTVTCPATTPMFGSACNDLGLTCDYTHGIPRVGATCTCIANAGGSGGMWRCLLAGGPLLPPEILPA